MYLWGMDTHTHVYRHVHTYMSGCVYMYFKPNADFKLFYTFLWRNFLVTSLSAPPVCKDLKGKDDGLFTCTWSTIPCIEQGLMSILTN